MSDKGATVPSFSEFVYVDAERTEKMKEIGRVRLSGDGWYIDVKPTADRTGLDINSNISLLVMPRVANSVQVFTDLSRDTTIVEEATKLFECWKSHHLAEEKRNKHQKK